MSNDSLYRIPLKCLVLNELREVLVVKESGRGSWDLPGGGIDHNETIAECVARELREEVAYAGDFTYDTVTIEDPKKLQTRDTWQIRVVVRIYPDNLNFSVGKQSDEVRFVDPIIFMDSTDNSEKAIYGYVEKIKQKTVTNL